MQVYEDENYGADADGRRGIEAVYYELENTKQEMFGIASVLFNQGIASDETGQREIRFEGIDIVINIEDYKDLILGLEEADDAICSIIGEKK